MNSTKGKKAQAADLWITIALLGSLWGFSEVVVNAVIKAIGLPYRAGILTGIGFSLMAIAVATSRKPILLPMIAFVAVGIKQLVVPILHVSVMCKANSCLAVMLEGLALASTVAIAQNMLYKSKSARTLAGVSAALLAATAFHGLGLRLAPCQYLLSFDRPGGLLAFLATEGMPWAIFSGVFFPLGYQTGEWLKDIVSTLQMRRPFLYYTASAAIVLGCWLASAIAIASGF